MSDTPLRLVVEKRKFYNYLKDKKKNNLKHVARGISQRELRLMCSGSVSSVTGQSSYQVGNPLSKINPKQHLQKPPASLQTVPH